MAAAMQFTTFHARGDNEPVWSFTVPASTLTSDERSKRGLDHRGCGRQHAHHHPAYHDFHVHSVSAAGSQIILLDNRGRLVGAGDFASINSAIPNFVSAKKAVISAGGLMELTVGANKTLVTSALPFADNGETLAGAPDATTVDHKFVHSSTITSNKVSEIRCYVLKKLKPQPVCGWHGGSED